MSWLSRLLGYRTPEQRREHERLTKAANAARLHRERSESRLEASLSRVQRLLEAHDHDSEPRRNGAAD